MLLVASSYVDELRPTMTRRRQGFSKSHVLEDLGQEVLAGVGLAEDGTGLQLSFEECGWQGIDVDCIEEGMEVLRSAFRIPANPVDAGLVDLRLAEHL